MPNGRYSLHDPHDGTPLGEERFSCAPGPAGWRYVSKTYRPDGTVLGTTDLTLDARHRPIRLELRAGDWQVRGGALEGVHWVRAAAETGLDAAEGQDRAHAFTGDSPAFLVATARLLALDPGADARIRLVSFTGDALAPRTLDQGWQLHAVEDHPTDTGPLPVEHYRVTDLDTGEVREIHLTGDVLLAAPGIDLEELDTPPNPRR